MRSWSQLVGHQMVNALDLTSKRQSRSELDSVSSIGSEINPHLSDTDEKEVTHIEATNTQEKQP